MQQFIGKFEVMLEIVNTLGLNFSKVINWVKKGNVIEFNLNDFNIIVKWQVHFSCISMRISYMINVNHNILYLILI